MADKLGGEAGEDATGTGELEVGEFSNLMALGGVVPHIMMPKVRARESPSLIRSTFSLSAYDNIIPQVPQVILIHRST